MNSNVLRVLKTYLALSPQERIDFLKEINKIEKMPRVVKKDQENMINALPA
jgi:hypothetical protein